MNKNEWPTNKNKKTRQPNEWTNKRNSNSRIKKNGIKYKLNNHTRCEFNHTHAMTLSPRIRVCHTYGVQREEQRKKKIKLKKEKKHTSNHRNFAFA